MGYKVVAKNAEQRITRLIEKRRQFISGLGERLIEKSAGFPSGTGIKPIKRSRQSTVRFTEKNRQPTCEFGERLIEKRKRPTIGSGGRLTPKRILQEIIAAELASQELPSVALTTKQSRSETGCCAVCAANG
uniref:Uncharacterized protein n=1 Tax=viral metagenome TaxID=1070528 RepID=A0A6M3XYY7_9ZZZZ